MLQGSGVMGRSNGIQLRVQTFVIGSLVAIAKTSGAQAIGCQLVQPGSWALSRGANSARARPAGTVQRREWFMTCQRASALATALRIWIGWCECCCCCFAVQMS